MQSPTASLSPPQALAAEAALPAFGQLLASAPQPEALEAPEAVEVLEEPLPVARRREGQRQEEVRELGLLPLGSRRKREGPPRNTRARGRARQGVGGARARLGMPQPVARGSSPARVRLGPPELSAHRRRRRGGRTQRLPVAALEPRALQQWALPEQWAPAARQRGAWPL